MMHDFRLLDMSQVSLSTRLLLDVAVLKENEKIFQ